MDLAGERGEENETDICWGCPRGDWKLSSAAGGGEEHSGGLRYGTGD